MKQRITTTLLLCVMTVLSMYANPITREQARQKAAKFLTDKKGKRSLKAVTSPGKLAPETETERYYVFDRGNDEGYVIVSGDDETFAILGYTDQGSFDYSALPPNMKEWLDGYASQIAAIQTKKVAGRRASITVDIVLLRSMLSRTWVPLAVTVFGTYMKVSKASKNEPNALSLPPFLKVGSNLSNVFLSPISLSHFF